LRLIPCWFQALSETSPAKVTFFALSFCFDLQLKCPFPEKKALWRMPLFCDPKDSLLRGVPFAATSAFRGFFLY